MYDARNEPHEFVGQDREEAVGKACKFFGVDRDALRISELRAGEVFGLGSRSVVVASLRDRKRSPSGERFGAGSRGEGSRRPERGRREREPRREPEREPRREPEREPRRDTERAPARPAELSVGTAEGELGAIGRFLLGVIERMDLGPFAIRESVDGELLAVNVSGAAARNLSAGDGRAADALQLLANQVAARDAENDQRIVVDVEGDAEARESLLAGLAHRVARRARETGRPVRLDPMNAADRRLIHLALREVSDVATMSTGQGRYRQVVVVPEGAPEFEQARRESEAVASHSD